MTEPEPTSSLENSLAALVAGALVTLLLAVLVISQLSRGIWQQQAASSRLLLEQVERIADEGNRTIERLNNRGDSVCSEELLGEMRKTLFFASAIRDIGFVRDGKLICSAVTGQLASPKERPSSDFQTFRGFRVWTRATIELFGQPLTATVSQKGNFLVVFDDRPVLNLFPSTFNWQLVYHHDGHVEPELGRDGVFRGTTEPEFRSASFSSHYYSACSDSHPQCVGVEVSNLALMRQYPGLLVLLAGACLVGGIATSLSIVLLLRWRTSPGNRLRRGIGHGSLYPLYQPIIELTSGRVVGCEVLARFQDRYGPLYPDQFIPLIAQMKLSWPFTRQIIREAVDSLDKASAIPDGFLVNINLFPPDIASGQIRDLANVQAWTQSRLQLNFEITEDQQLDSTTAHANLQWLRDQGYGLAVDDFGTGYCNLSHLRDLLCDTLKIDRSFITGIEDGGVRAAIAPIMVHLAEELQLKVVAEGIENEAQRDIVMDLGVQYGQGWLYGKPMTAEELAAMINGDPTPEPRHNPDHHAYGVTHPSGLTGHP